MDEKKRNKYLANAEEKFQKEQLKAAALMEQIDKSVAIIEMNKDELTKEQLDEIYGAIATRRQEVSEFLMTARDKYAAKLKELGDPTLADILDPEDLV
jgi:phosphopantetheine adenylyltransferase